MRIGKIFLGKLALGLVLLAAGRDANASGSSPSAIPESGGNAVDKRQIAVVIDDFGNGMKGTEQMLNLPIKLTAAIMPFLPTTKEDAEKAHRLGHDVIVHLPMEPVRGQKNWLGPGAITTDLSDGEIRKRVEAAIADVPHAIGMNNHMGSKATADKRVMRIVLQVCKEKGLIFLDSRTSFRTVVPAVAKEVGIETVRNDIFLDDVYTRQHALKQLQEVKKLLQKNERCVAIGHVGPPGLSTSDALRAVIPELKGKAEFVPLSALLSLPGPFTAQGLQSR
ncbi:divergent polysaccharide deacetylase family protein [Cohnella sp.]|uniref:divergent polysaccharide deacetylase family protein n=1 Tax=Cohnella sp. TaxID=1883426 RepID=UPI003704A299